MEISLDSYSISNRHVKLELKTAWMFLVLAALVILAVGEFTHIDLLIEDFYYDPVLKTFPWKHTWFAEDLMHIYVKNGLMACACLLYAVLAIDLFKPWRGLNPGLRFKLRFVAIASVVIPITVSILKQHSVLHCPWDIDRYHGAAPFIKLLDHIPGGMDAGACFPAGHATTGLWLASLCVLWLPHHPKKARLVFMAGLSVGFILGWVQQMRGAHFLFHTLWSMWITSLIILMMLQCANIPTSD